MNVMDYIKEYVDQIEVTMPIFTKDIYKYVESKVSTIKKCFKRIHTKIPKNKSVFFKI